jgi:hypothetical protein
MEVAVTVGDIQLAQSVQMLQIKSNKDKSDKKVMSQS